MNSRISIVKTNFSNITFKVIYPTFIQITQQPINPQLIIVI